MKRKSLLLFFLIVSCMTVCADTVEKVTVDGSTVSKFVTKLTFSGDNVILNFDDNTTQTCTNPSGVSIDFTYSATTGINNAAIKDNVNADKRIYSINGQYVGTTTDGLRQGIYITSGKKFVVK
jgi:hypothetical protein